MAYTDYVKSQVKHHRCVICGRTFGAKYDEILKSFPVFHPYAGHSHVLNCEDIFYKEVLRLYRYLHDSGDSKTMRNVLEEFPWSSRIGMRKEMLEWCMRQGYFDLSNLKRLQVPPAIEDACKELFTVSKIDDPNNQKSAVELLKAALRCYGGELIRPDDCDMPIQTIEIDRGVTTLFDNIDISAVELRSQRGGMATSASSGAQEIEKRMHSAIATMERRRLENAER